jgi:hypothetical protein
LPLDIPSASLYLAFLRNQLSISDWLAQALYISLMEALIEILFVNLVQSDMMYLI